MTFTRESTDDDWTGSLELHGKRYSLEIRAGYERDELDEIATRAQQYLAANWERILEVIVMALLEMANDDWREESSTPLSAAEFLARLGHPDIHVWEEEVLVLYFPDGGLFAGHTIEVFIEVPDAAGQREITAQILG